MASTASPGIRSEPEQTVEIVDPSIGLEAVIVVDAFVDGRAAGGIRRAPYPSFDAAIRDARGLARAMSLKCAMADLPVGGAKTVVREGEDLDVDAAYEAIGEAVAGMDGAYLCGPDVGTGPAELDRVRAVTEHVNPAENEPARATARGVVAGIRGVLRAIDGDAVIEGSRFVLQGYGSVGAEIARRLNDAGGQVLVAEVDPERRAQAAEEGNRPIDPDEALATVCDVFVPCALGGIVTEAAAGELPARAVCGAANEQLASPKAAGVLHERGVAYAPDFVVNAGAVVEGALTVRHGRRPEVLEEVRARIDAVEERVAGLLEASRAEDRSPHALALEAARTRLLEG